MKKSLFFAVCGFALFASSSVALAQSTPPPVYSNCGSDVECWARAGGSDGYSFASGHSVADNSVQGVRAGDYAEYYASQPFSVMNNALNRYWNAYADSISNYNSGVYYGGF